MTGTKERRFSIDPGKGRKMDGCPYSIYEDGRDVKDYIIPPKGYVFKGFIFDPDANNQIYDGKLTAEYEKEAFNDILKSNLWKFVLAFAVIAVIAGIVWLAVSVFNDPKSAPKNTEQKPDTQVVDTPAVDHTTTDNSINALPKEEEKPTVTQAEETVEAKPVKPVDPNDPTAVFNAKFWTLIHKCEVKMDPYDSLYRDNQKKVSGEEYEYLRFTILENYASFQAWTKQLKQIPTSELESINTIESLKQRLKATK